MMIVLLLLACANANEPEICQHARGIKGSVISIECFLDMLMPAKSLLIFIGFICIVIVAICMILIMTCRFVDCLTDVFCNKAIQERNRKKKEKEKIIQDVELI